MDKKKIEKITDLSVIINANDYEQNLTYYPRSQAMLSILPYKKTNENYYTRQNGNYKITVTAHREYGMPYGSYPRLLFMYMFNYCQQNKTNVISLGNSVYDFLKKLGIVPGAITYRRIREQSLALFNSTINISENTKKSSRNKNFVISRENHIFWNSDKDNVKDLWHSYVVINQDLYDEFLAMPVPALTEVIKGIKNSAFQLDLYCFLNWRVYVLNKQNKRDKVFITNEQLQKQFGANYKTTNDFKKALIRNLRVIKAFWFDLNVETNRYGMVIHKSELLIEDQRP